MFAPISDYIETVASVSCFTNHPTLQRAWKDDLERLNKVSELDNEEAQEFILYGVERFLERATNNKWRFLSHDVKTLQIKAVLERPQIAQRTAEWYAQAQTMITASEFASLFASERQYANLVLSKAMPPLPKIGTSRLACPTNEMSPFDWGIRYEPVVKQIFEKRWNVQVFEAGRITHSTDTRLAASPDGILSTGNLLEIKCPISREIGGDIPFEYWCQMQIQMEVTGIDACEYLEVKLEAAHSKKKYVRPEEPLAEGCLWLFSKEVDYIYSYIYAYTQEEKAKKEAEGWSLLEEIPWALASFHHVTLQRDAQWFEETAVIREKFWKDVEEAKAGQFRIPSPSTPRQKVCRIRDSPPQDTMSTL